MEKTIIKAETVSWLPNFGELYKYRQLLLSLAWRDVKVKYAQTFIGLTWAFINPIFNLLILSFVFGKVAKVETDGIPHILFTIIGLSAWTYFSTLLNEAGNSILGAQGMVKKLYFPRLIIPLSKSLSGLVDFLITFLCLILIMIYYQFIPGKNVIWLPLFLFIAIISGLAGGILTSALAVRYRDFSFIVPMISRIGLFATPIAYSTSSVPEQYKFYYFLNPMAGVVEGFRWSLIGTSAPEPYMYISLGIMFLLLIVGLIYFTRVERTMADII